jgi:hypothetical protein
LLCIFSFILGLIALKFGLKFRHTSYFVGNFAWILLCDISDYKKMCFRQDGGTLGFHVKEEVGVG